MSRTASVVICAYSDDRWNDLLHAIASVARQSVPALQTIVAIDHNDALLERVSKLPGIVAVANEEEPGLSGARNSGLRVARGDVVAFLDDDAVAAADWLEHLLAAYDDPRVLGVGGPIEPAWREGRPRWFPYEFDWVVGCTYLGMPKRTAPVRNPIGANMSFRREVFELAGGFRSGIGRVGTTPLGCEETELCIRARQRCPEALFVYEPQARVVHKVPSGRARLRYFASRCYAEGRSKAIVARLTGAGDALSSERSYTTRVLPRGVLRGVADAIVRGEPSGIARAGAIVAGLAVTTVGFVVGSAGRA